MRALRSGCSASLLPGALEAIREGQVECLACSSAAPNT
jgi:hypothetical protein